MPSNAIIKRRQLTLAVLIVAATSGLIDYAQSNSDQLESSDKRLQLTNQQQASASTLPSEQSKIRPPNSNNERKTTSSQQQSSDCEYEKGQWSECSSNGFQERSLKLRQTKEGNGKRQCQPIKIVRRECQLGCKYARGEWSSSCNSDGLRVRLDTLVGTVESLASTSATVRANNCPAQRRVTKDCRRACHYIKSAWSECTNGFRTRNLTLDESQLPASQTIVKRQRLVRRMSGENGEPSASSLMELAHGGNEKHCVKQKRIRRECRDNQQQQQAKSGGKNNSQTGNKPRDAATSNSNNNGGLRGSALSSQVATTGTSTPNSAATITAATAGSSSGKQLTAIQKRRLKLQQLQQQQRTKSPLSADTNQLSTKTTTTTTAAAASMLPSSSSTSPAIATTTTSSTTTTSKR